jgi:hypothetical protein
VLTACKDFVACGAAAVRDCASIAAAVWGRTKIIIPVIDAGALHVEVGDAAEHEHSLSVEPTFLSSITHARAVPR